MDISKETLILLLQLMLKIRCFEERVRERKGYTISLGADDENNMTSVSGIDLYPDVLGHLSNIRNIKGHPYEFYQKMGYTIVGILPDANGPGKPDIYMAKRVGDAGELQNG